MTASRRCAPARWPNSMRRSAGGGAGTASPTPPSLTAASACQGTFTRAVSLRFAAACAPTTAGRGAAGSATLRSAAGAARLAEMEMIAMRVGQSGDREPAGLVLRCRLAGELRQLLQQGQRLQLQRIEIEGVAFGWHLP